ncbi:MAG: Fur family transcriptional regulator [Armatimonadota bacterium]
MSSSFDRFVDLLRRRGLKHTSQRHEILKQFLAMGGHVSAEELYNHMRRTNPGIGFSTVYRTLNLLADCGLARRVHFGDGRTRFDANTGVHHDHLVCERCGKTIEFSVPEIERLQEAVAASHDFEVRYHRLELYGLCASCKRELASSAEPEV